MIRSVPPQFNWEAIATATGQAFRYRVGDRTPLKDDPEAALPMNVPRPPPPPETALVIPARGDATLRLKLPWKLPDGDYLLRFGYEDRAMFANTGGDAVIGAVVSAPLAFKVSR